MNTKQYWDSVAGKKEFTAPFDKALFEKFVPKSAGILDVGCGYGRTMGELNQNGYNNLTGIDFSEKMIETAKHSLPFAKFSVQNGSELSFPDNSFDAVLLFAVLTCIISDNDQQKLIKEINRVLKPGGIVYINDFLLNTDDRNLQRYKEFENKYNVYGAFELPEGAVLRHHDERRIAMLTDIFEKKVFEKSVYNTMNGNKTNGFCFLGKKVKL